MFGANYFSSIYFGEDNFQHQFGQTFTVSLSDTLGLTDSNSYQFTYGRVLTDTEGMTDLIDRTVSFLRSLSDTEGITDVISRAQTYNLLLSDILGITDSLRRAVNTASGGPTHNSLEEVRPSSSLFIYKSLNILESVRPEILKLIKQ